MQVPSVEAMCIDLQNVDEVKAVVSQIDGIQLLVNNAGFADLQPFLEVTTEAYDQ